MGELVYMHVAGTLLIPFTLPPETGLAYSHVHLNQFQNVKVGFEASLSKWYMQQVFFLTVSLKLVLRCKYDKKRCIQSKSET